MSESIKYKGYTIELHQDCDTDSPREWDNFSEFTFFHSRYNLGDKHNYSPDDFQEFMNEHQDYLFVPVYMYEHGNICLSTEPFECPWDSGLLGFAWVRPERIQHEFGGDMHKAINCIRGEVATYSSFLEGDVWYWEVRDSEGGYVDGCGGNYGRDYAIADAKNMVDHEVKSPV